MNQMELHFATTEGDCICILQSLRFDRWPASFPSFSIFHFHWIYESLLRLEFCTLFMNFMVRWTVYLGDDKRFGSNLVHLDISSKLLHNYVRWTCTQTNWFYKKMSKIINLTKKHGKGTILQELSNVHSKETDHLNVIQNFCKEAWKCLKQLIIKNKLSVK